MGCGLENGMECGRLDTVWAVLTKQYQSQSETETRPGSSKRHICPIRDNKQPRKYFRAHTFDSVSINF